MTEHTDLGRIQSVLSREFPSLAEHYGVASLGLFGSYVRHEQRPESDLDILVTFTCTPSLLRFVELENHMSDLLRIKVDLVMRDSLKPSVGRQIANELVPVPV